MANNKFMGTFDNETEVLRKIEELKTQGTSEDHMYVMARDKEQISMVRGRTDVDYKSTEGNWKDKFMGFLSGNEPVREAFNGLGVDGDEADRYYNEVQNGKILLFVDKEMGDNYSRTSENYTGRDEGKSTLAGGSVYGDPTVENTRATGHSDSGIVARDGLTVDTNEANDIDFHRERNMVDSDDTSAASRLDDETAGVGRDTGTGFGLGTGNTVDDTPRPSRDTNDFTATNEVDRSDRFDDTDRTTGGLTDRDRTTGGFTDTDRTTSGLTGNDLNRDHTHDEEERLRLHEERLHVNKDRVQTGEVNVGKHVVEDEQTIEVPVEREEVYVERRPVNEESTDGGLTGDAYQEGDNIHIPVTEERVDVSKTDVVSEEIVVGKRKVQDTETVSETVRREEADIDEDHDVDDLGRNRKDRL